MNIKKTITDNLFYVFFTLCSVILTGSSLLLISDHNFPATTGITSFIFVLVTLFIFINRKKPAVYLGIALLVLLILFIFRTAGISVLGFTHKAAVHLFTGHKFSKGERIFVASVISMLLSAVFFPLLRIRIARYAVSVMTVALLVYYGICGFHFDVVETFSAGGIILSSLTELYLFMLYRNESGKKISNILSFLLPMFMLFSFSVAIIPSSEKPISWNFVKKIINAVSSSFDSLITEIDLKINPEKTEFNINMQGFSDSNDVFGCGISDIHQSQLKLWFQSHPYSSLYLTGNVSDKYTGKGWEKSKSDSDISSENDFYLDYCETMLAFERIGITRDTITEFTKMTSLFIEYDDIKTISMFYPIKTVNIDSFYEFDASSPSVTLDRRAETGDSYSVNYLEINYQSDQFRNTARSEFSYNSDLPDPSADLINTKVPDDLMKILSKRSEYIKNTYTKLPECITQRTYSLADEITQKYNGDYDKLCAIEEYLKGYKYTKTPGPVPDGYDPIDYFLFESGSGYCTYFASSMAILARCIGIPTRYVQGFAVDCSKSYTPRDFPVSGSQAHAWVEAYIEGVGWVPFEPTASGNNRYNYNGEPYSPSGITFNEHDYSYQHDHIQPDVIPGITKKDGKSSSDNNGNFLFYIFISVTVLFIILLFISLYIFIKLRVFIRKYHSGTDTEKFLTCYRMMLYLYDKNKLKLKNGETIACFAHRISEEDNDEKYSFSSVTSVFDRIRYREDKASVEECRLAEEYLKNMFVKLRQKRRRSSALKAFIGYCFTQ